jgi:hypothetical protein
VLGQDVLLGTGLRVTDEDLAVARCRLSLIRRVGFVGRIRRVATRYPRLASRYLSRSQGVEVVALILTDHHGRGRALEEGFRCVSGAGVSLLLMLALRGPIEVLRGSPGPALWTGDRAMRFERLAVSDQQQRPTGNASNEYFEERGDGSGRDRLGVGDAPVLCDRRRRWGG